VLIAVVPMYGLYYGFSDIQKLYTIIGAWFFPVLALALLIFNGRSLWVGRKFRNGPVSVAALVVVLVFFVWVFIQS
jgi:hypothetical protein